MKTRSQSGFITLFFVMSVSMTFLMWISIGSERVFEYIDIKARFYDNKNKAYNILTCAHGFVDNNIKSKYTLSIIDKSYTFYRNIDIEDQYICEISNIDIKLSYDGNHIIVFTIDKIRFEYIFKKGFFESMKSSVLF